MKRKSDLVVLAEYFKSIHMHPPAPACIRGIEYRGFEAIGTNLYVSPSGKLRSGANLESSHLMGAAEANNYVQAARRYQKSLEVVHD